MGEVDEAFDLVMISEQMRESLVLLADLLCISLEDLATLKEFIHLQKNETVQKLSRTHTKTLMKSLGPERLLYKHFTDRLEERIRSV